MQVARQRRSKKEGKGCPVTDAWAPRDGAEGNGDLNLNDYTTETNYNSGILHMD